MPAAERQKHARAFLMKGFQKQSPTSSEFCAYGQACVEMASGLFQLLREHKAVLFASLIPRESGKATEDEEEYLRKDKVFLLERCFYFLERERQNGLLVMDGTEKNLDRKFVRQLEDYFTKTNRTPGGIGRSGSYRRRFSSPRTWPTRYRWLTCAFTASIGPSDSRRTA